MGKNVEMIFIWVNEPFWGVKMLAVYIPNCWFNSRFDWRKQLYSIQIKNILVIEWRIMFAFIPSKYRDNAGFTTMQWRYMS